MSYNLIEKDTVKSVLQNVDIILRTAKGEDYLRPDFGVDILSFIDRPLTELDKGKLKAMIIDEIEFWEERAKVRSCNISVDSGVVIVNLTLEIDDEQVGYELVY